MDDPTPQDNSNQQGQQIHISGLNDPAPVAGGTQSNGNTGVSTGTQGSGASTNGTQNSGASDPVQVTPMTQTAATVTPVTPPTPQATVKAVASVSPPVKSATTPPPVTGPSADDKAPKKEYNIPDVVMQKYPDLVELIKATESMSDEEREYWFQILPIMTEEQVKRLRGILEEEKTQLAKLDQEYQQEMSKLNQKHLNEWDEFEKKKQREEREEAEKADQVNEAQTEAALLDELENL